MTSIEFKTLIHTAKCAGLDGEALATCWFGPPKYTLSETPAEEPDVLYNPWHKVERQRKPKKKAKRDRNATTPQKRGRMGEALTKFIYEKKGILLKKIVHTPMRHSLDVDFTCDEKFIKVEAKAWWIYNTNRFNLARITDKERGYLARASRSGWDCFITIMLLTDADATRRGCDTLYNIPWLAWLELEAALKGRSAGNYKGASIRKRDLVLIEKYAIKRIKGRWAV